MAAAFDLALSRVRNSSDHHLVPARIDQLARAAGHVFRQTTLTPGNTLRLFVRQVAHGNVACSAVRHLGDDDRHDDFSDSAWVKSGIVCKQLGLPHAAAMCSLTFLPIA